jgi:hypothetical protein
MQTQKKAFQNMNRRLANAKNLIKENTHQIPSDSILHKFPFIKYVATGVAVYKLVQTTLKSTSLKDVPGMLFKA